MKAPVTWEHGSPGISFSLKYGRIMLFKATLDALEYPEYFRFMFGPDAMLFAVQKCGIDDEGAHRLPDERRRNYYTLNSLDLVRFVYRSCEWNEGYSYRVAGIRWGPVIYFELKNALEIREGKLFYFSG